MQNFAYLRACKIFLSTKCKQGSNNQKNNYWVSKRFFGDLNSQTVGMDSWVQSALKSILRENPIFYRLHDFSLLSKIHFNIHFWNQNSRKKSLTPKNFIFEGWFLYCVFFLIAACFPYKIHFFLWKI